MLLACKIPTVKPCQINYWQRQSRFLSVICCPTAPPPNKTTYFVVPSAGLGLGKSIINFFKQNTDLTLLQPGLFLLCISILLYL